MDNKTEKETKKQVEVIDKVVSIKSNTITMLDSFINDAGIVSYGLFVGATSTYVSGKITDKEVLVFIPKTALIQYLTEELTDSQKSFLNDDDKQDGLLLATLLLNVSGKSVAFSGLQSVAPGKVLRKTKEGLEVLNPTDRVLYQAKSAVWF